MMNGNWHDVYQRAAVQRHLDEIQLNLDQMKAAAGDGYVRPDQAEALVALVGKLLRRVAMASIFEEIRSNGGITFDQPEKAS